MSEEAATLMDRMYRPQRYIYDLTRKHYLLGRDRLIAELAPPDGSAILEIGCGTGRNLIRAAQRYPSVKLYGVDISSVMLDQARRSVESAGLAARISLAQGDASSFDPGSPFGRKSFERIFISYALSMIPPWRETIAHALDLVAEGGALHIVDFGDQSGMPHWFRLLLKTWLDLFHVSPRLEIETEFRKEARARGFIHHHAALYRGYAFHAFAVQSNSPRA
jgi:S-adenosylmethionine-diacylgycerolhomoserine-N-methlytransferase